MNYPDMEAEYLTCITAPGLTEVFTVLIYIGELGLGIDSQRSATRIKEK
jgi:hypothetical protein